VIGIGLAAARHPGADAVAQQPGDAGFAALDLGERARDRLPDRDPGAFGRTARPPLPAAKPGRRAELFEQRVALGCQPGRG
jgi:hypothetical protein